ncbi:Imidazolonepropionase [Amphibacillus marinus]|uniref:Imidazolonepropionase n=1 Tax=Amphibacillus marinus TaxID=872970 RepID=A0A1H8M596_9BACI|nr:amidohydrolase family protein [Amphibacillus marinus]SEO12557.1 Imidazolonepropionase [Amphibacillus marinus]
MSYTLKNCRLIPELSGQHHLTIADVYVDEGKIISIADPDSHTAQGIVIDCKGKTLLPGLFDLHVHLHSEEEIMPTAANHFTIMKKAMQSAQLYLDYGFTTVRDMGSTNRVSHAVREVINEGLFIGPRVIGGGKIIRPTSKENYHAGDSFIREVTGHNEMLKAAREEFAEGADIIKIYASGSALQTSGVPTQPIFLPEEIRAAVTIATMEGKKVAAHCHSREAINMCLADGVYTIEHATYVDDEAIEILKTEQSYLVPTLTPMHHRKPNNRDPKDDAILEKKLKVLAEASSKRLRTAYQAGLKMGFGTDVSIHSFSNRIGIEFKMRKELCGMENIDILLQATKYSALIAGLEGVTGEIKEGYEADLILMDGNPDQDLTVMYEKPAIVFKNGIKVV